MSVERELWCRQCRAYRLAVLRPLAGVLVYRCGVCRHWSKCPDCVGTMTPEHSARCSSVKL